MMAFSLDFAILKEPLGFIRVLEWVFAIFAFASTCNYFGQTSFNVQCQEASQIHVISISFTYPFRLNKLEVSVPACNVNGSAESKTFHLVGDYSSSAEFFVAVGVLAFLYCTAMLVVYLGYKQLYLESSRGPILDLLVTGAFTFLWLVSACAWAKGLTDVKLVTSPTTLVVNQVCRTNKCTPGALPSFGSVNSSVIGGFLNVVLWAESCWLVYKETPFHKPSAPSAAVNQEGTRQP